MMEGVEVKVEVDVYEEEEEEEKVPGFLGLAEQQLSAIISPSVNRNLYLVPEDLQQLIMESNPGRAKFTVSQRLNTQLVLDDYVLKKKLGPEVRKVSLSLICCVSSIPIYLATTPKLSMYAMNSIYVIVGVSCGEMDLLEEGLPIFSDLT